jgi:hypothetical protein
VYCRGCNYPLDGLPCIACNRPGACPECGTEFDPGDSETYNSSRGDIHAARGRRILKWVCAATPLAGAALCLLTLVVARLQLGRWPHRGGMDDPKSIPFVPGMMALSCLWILWVPVSGVIVVRMALRDYHNGRPLWPGAVTLALWCLGLLLLLADPGDTFTWFAD